MSSHFCEPCRSILELYHRPRTREPEQYRISDSFRIYTSHSFEENASNYQCRLCILILSIYSEQSVKNMRAQDLQDNDEQGFDRIYKTWFEMQAWGDDRERHLLLARAWGTGNDGLVLPNRKVKWDYKQLRMTSIEIPGFPSQRPSAESTGHPTSLDGARAWLEECCANHPSCQPNTLIESSLPTRLIYIGKHSPLALRLSKNIPRGSKYATLSHRWGSDIPLRLLSSNIQSIMLHLPEDQLPNKFLDAITVAQYLGLEYLWIDSLCIIQDSVSDWLTESGVMGQIYLHAQINIAGTTGTPNGEGLFYQRDVRFIEPCIVSYELPGSKQRSNFTIMFESIWFWGIEAAPLNRRAWVCQERYLSPRTIHFTKNQLFWECHSTAACELFPGGLPKNLYNSQPKRLSLDKWGPAGERWPWGGAYYRAYGVWAEVISVYTFSDLKFSTDKLIAISALAWYWHSLVGEEIQYLAGLWRRNLATQLLWKSFGGVYPSITQKEWRAPSWSWASIDGPITMPEMAKFDDEREILVKVNEAEVNLISQDRFGPVSGGRITLCGRLARIAVRSTMTDAIEVRGVWKPNYKILIDLDCCIQTRASAFLNLNYEDGVWIEGVFQQLYFMPVRTTTTQSRLLDPRNVPFTEGLILRKIEGSQDTFLRWGMGEIGDSVDRKIFAEAFRDFDLSAEQSGLEYTRGEEDGATSYKVHII